MTKREWDQNQYGQNLTLTPESLKVETIQITNNLTAAAGTQEYNGYIPPAAFSALEREAVGIVSGMATLTLNIRGGKLISYTTGRDRSFMFDSQPEQTPEENTIIYVMTGEVEKALCALDAATVRYRDGTQQVPDGNPK